MPILGTFVDRTAGVSLSGLTTTTLNHSLAAAPDAVFVQQASASSVTALSSLYALRGNASLNTVGLAIASAAGGTQSTVSFDFYAQVIHTVIR